MTDSSNAKINFEEALKNLKKIVEKLEDNDITLEESLTAFEQGIELSRRCEQALTRAEQRVRGLIEDKEKKASQETATSD